jgi:hypothetical protein
LALQAELEKERVHSEEHRQRNITLEEQINVKAAKCHELEERLQQTNPPTEDKRYASMVQQLHLLRKHGDSLEKACQDGRTELTRVKHQLSETLGLLARKSEEVENHQRTVELEQEQEQPRRKSRRVRT